MIRYGIFFKYVHFRLGYVPVLNRSQLIIGPLTLIELWITSLYTLVTFYLWLFEHRYLWGYIDVHLSWWDWWLDPALLQAPRTVEMQRLVEHTQWYYIANSLVYIFLINFSRFPLEQIAWYVLLIFHDVTWIRQLLLPHTVSAPIVALLRIWAAPWWFPSRYVCFHTWICTYTILCILGNLIWCFMEQVLQIYESLSLWGVDWWWRCLFLKSRSI